ncbi:MAG: hypothetical protein ACP5PX_00950 [Candidatus Hadarchaeum sp.]|uniref:hypothetical protein n=1 Tax=Candidatus Hadarchaeum sp. TaxID=2883567 RepID=UPI003D110D32
MKRPLVALLVLVAGVFLMLEGSKLYTVSFLTDLILLIGGAVLTISYLPLMGDYLTKKFGGNSVITYLPVLAVLGAGLIWQSGFRILALTDRIIFVVIGAILLAASLIYLRGIMKSGSK